MPALASSVFTMNTLEHAPRHAVKFHSSAVSTISIVHYYFHFYFIYLELFALHVLSIYSFESKTQTNKIENQLQNSPIGERRNPRGIEDSFVPSKRAKVSHGRLRRNHADGKVCTSSTRNSRYTSQEKQMCTYSLLPTNPRRGTAAQLSNQMR